MRRNSMRRNPPARRGPAVVVVIPPWLLAVAVTVVVGLVAGLAGCTGSAPGPAPTSLHPGTAATPTTSTPTSDPTDLAGAAAIAAVQKLYAEYNAMLTSGSSAAYRQTFTRACTFCVGNANRVDVIHGKGQRIYGGAVKLTDLRPADTRERLVVVEGTMTDSPVVVKRGKQVVARFAGGSSAHFTWTVRQVAELWVVTDEQVPR